MVATLVLGRSLGSNILVDLLVAGLTAIAAVALGYLFSEDWRALILGLMKRARVFVGGPAKRAKPASPVNTNAQK